MTRVSIPDNVLKKIKGKSTYPVNKIKKAKKDITAQDILDDPSESNITKFVDVYKAKVLKDFEHPVKILADQTDILLKVQGMIYTEILKSRKEGFMDIQMAEALRRFAVEIVKTTIEIKPDWEVAVEDVISEDVVEAIMDLETFFEFLGDKDPNMVEEFIEYRIRKMKSSVEAVELSIEDSEVEI